MESHKQPLSILVYALVFFGLLAVVSYLLLFGNPTPTPNNSSTETFTVPNYQNLFGSR